MKKHDTNSTSSCPFPNAACDCPEPDMPLAQTEEVMKLPLKRKAKMTDKEKIAKLEADVASYVAELKAIKKLVAPKASSFIVWDPKWMENLKDLIKYAHRVDEDYVQDRILGNQHGIASLKLLNASLMRLKRSWR